jgi:hypothetical protein
MKTIATAIIIALTTMTSSESVTQQDTVNNAVMDNDFLKKELQQSIQEFCEDTDINPDSVYMPFRDTL